MIGPDHVTIILVILWLSQNLQTLTQILDNQIRIWQIIGIISTYIRVIIVWGDGQFPTVAGNPAAPSCAIYRKLKSVSRMLGNFPRGFKLLTIGHVLAGQRRLIVLKVNENFSSQIPSCWYYAAHNGLQNHPPLPNAVPPDAAKLRHVDDIWSVKQCPHDDCGIIWNRDINACR